MHNRVIRAIFYRPSVNENYNILFNNYGNFRNSASLNMNPASSER